MMKVGTAVGNRIYRIANYAIRGLVTEEIVISFVQETLCPVEKFLSGHVSSVIIQDENY